MPLKLNFVTSVVSFHYGFDKFVIYCRYHSAPALDNRPNIYDTPDTGYLHVINDQYEMDHVYDYGRTEGEPYTSRYISSNYEEIDI